ncbi:MAG: response regulator, partial [Candidatus Hodarchaeales archaeon]
NENGKLILLIDDEPQILDLMKFFLCRINPQLRIETTESPIDGMVKILSENKNYDVIISDYIMPEFNGLQVLSHIRKKNNLTPFILLTAMDDPEIFIEVRNSKFTKFFLKTISLQVLSQKINDYITRILSS